MAAAGESDGSSRRMYRTDSFAFLRRITGRSRSCQQLLLMEAVGRVSAFTRNNGLSSYNNDEDDDDDDHVLLPGYERLSRSMRSPEDPDPIDRKKEKHRQKQKQVQKLMQYVFARRRGEDDAAAAAAAAKTEEKRRKKEKKRSSWLPDPEKRWPIQGWG